MGVSKVCGIDLGTTNSVGAILDLADSKLIFARFGDGKSREMMLPSAVAWMPEKNRFVVGRPARARRGFQPAPILSHKRGMGKASSYQLNGKEYSSIDLGALVLDAMVAQLRLDLAAAKESLDVDQAVITVPAHFKHPAMEATTLAGEKAGLKVVELLHEPTAAIIHYCWTRRQQIVKSGQKDGSDGQEETFLVFDMGGGTFDVSVIRRIPNTLSGDDFQTLAIAGDSFLGGDDFDAVIATDLFYQLGNSYHFETTNPGEEQNRERVVKLLALAEQIKIRLSDAEQVSVDRKDLFLDDSGTPVHLQAQYTRAQLETMIDGIARSTLDFCDQAMEEAGLRNDQIDGVLMIGGSSRTPLLKKYVAEHFYRGGSRVKGSGPIVHSPDLCVGAGAALKAASLGTIHGRRPGCAGLRMLGYGSTSQIRVSRRFEVCDSKGEGIAGAAASLSTSNGRKVVGRVLGAQRVLFDGIDLPLEQSTFFQCQLSSPRGGVIADFEFSLRNDPMFVEPLGISTSANVLSYELLLEVEGHKPGTFEKVSIAPKLTPLPQEFSHRFVFPGATDLLLFPLYGNGREIKTIRVPVPRETPAGANINLMVSIDASQKVRAQGQIDVGGRKETFDFEVEAPKVPSMPTLAQFHELDARVTAALQQYSGPDAGKLAMRRSTLWRDISRGFDVRDVALVTERMEELAELLQQLDPAKRRLEPPLEEVEKMVNECHVLLKLLPIDTSLHRDEVRLAVEANWQAAVAASKTMPPDQEKYTLCERNIKSCHTTLRDEYSRTLPPRSDAEQARSILKEINEELLPEMLAKTLDAEDREVLDKVEKLVSDAENALPTDPSDALGLARSAYAKAQELRSKQQRNAAAGENDDKGGGRRVKST